MDTYKVKTVPIKAIQFEYSQVGIENLRKVLGEKLLIVEKDRHIGALGQAVIIMGDKEVTVLEGQFITLEPMFKVFNATDFLSRFELHEQAKLYSIGA